MVLLVLLLSSYLPHAGPGMQQLHSVGAAGHCSARCSISSSRDAEQIAAQGSGTASMLRKRAGYDGEKGALCCSQ